MEENKFLMYISEIGLSPQRWYEWGSNIPLSIPEEGVKVKEINNLKKKYSNDANILQKLDEVNNLIVDSIVFKTFTVHEISRANNDYGDVVLMLYIPEFGYLLKATGCSNSYNIKGDSHEWDGWYITETSNGLKIKYD